MQQLNGFSDLRVGQQVKISGQHRDGRGFLAVEVTCEPAAEDEAKLEGLIQHVDPAGRYLHIFDQKVLVHDGVEIKDLDSKRVSASALQPGDMAKLKGVYHQREGFILRKITLGEKMDFNIEEIEGIVEKISPENKTLTVNGVTILMTPKTNIESEGRDDERG
ncbi:MAG: DUF5666 domain-containing protein [candidate division KSB1 bacterium]|nr:DUF5666 domain-containing protein [candidate division KSB1 bacterium]MDZ7369240.1 DUF5666 domain-containing protein [candidate division KSB1 bacterium]MDZ7407226.1 DUF5666 domain-containing protein [candidate division KSB1 bacterium]